MRSVAEVHLRDVIASDLPLHFEHQSDPESARLSVTDRTTEPPSRRTGPRSSEIQPGSFGPSSLTAKWSAAPFAGFKTTSARWGYRIGRGHWGKGIATAALFQLLAEVSERPLYATVAAHNPASRRVLEKCGFRQVDVERAGEAIMHVMRLD